MNGYWIGLLALSVMCAVIELLAPGGDNGVAVQLRLLCALCLLCVLAQPLARLLSEARELPERLREWLSEVEEAPVEEYQAKWDQEKQALEGDYARDYAAELLREAVCERFSLSVSDCRLAIEWEKDGTTPSQVNVALSGKAIWCPSHELEEYIRETLGCPCTVWLE